MLDEAKRKSFAHPETEFFLPKFPTTNRGQGFHKGEPTGVVVCLACLESDKNIDEIEHEPHCPQRFVHSRFFWEREAADATDEEAAADGTPDMASGIVEKSPSD